MNWPLYAGLLSFALAASFTPGPNNLIALSSGANFGIIRTIPHILGVALGFSLMIMLMGLGLGQLFQLYPMIYSVLQILCLLYLLYLAWKIATSGSIGSASDAEKPNSVLASALFQWVNPKAWFSGLTIVSTFTDPLNYYPSLFLNAATMFVIAWVSVLTWAAFGGVVKTILSGGRRLQFFNWMMAAALVVSTVPALLN